MNAINPHFVKEPQPDFLEPLEDVSGQMFEHLQMLTAIDRVVYAEVVEPGNDRRDPKLQATGDRLIALLTLLCRDMGATRDKLEAASFALYDQRDAAISSVGGHLAANGWLQPHPRLAAAMRKWTSALETYHDAARAEATLSPDDLTGAAIKDATSRALAFLIATPSPGLRAFRQKLSIVVQEGTMGNSDVPEMLLEDIDRLTNATDDEPWLVQTDAPASPCACPADADAADGAIVVEA